MKSFSLVLLASAVLALTAFGAPPASPTPPALPRERVSLNADWRFQKDDPSGVGDSLSYGKLRDWLLPAANAFREPAAAVTRPSGNVGADVTFTQPDFDDGAWRKLNLPHDWGIEGPFDQSLPGESGKLPWAGVGWYRKHFNVPMGDKGKQFFLDIDGAMSYAAVWCNGQFVGGWPYGYASWRLDLTPYLKPGGDNVLAIRLDNPKDSSRWYPGGGIYRNVWLVTTNPVHIAQWGTKITTPQISATSASVKVEVTVDNAGKLPAGAQAHTQIFRLVTKDGATTRVPDAASTLANLNISPGKSATVAQPILVKNPALWSTDAPNLYVALTRIVVNKQIVDAYETTFGIRKAEFTVKDGFHLNGKRLPIRGVCLHHDLGALGAAINIRAMERQLQIMKELGANGIRTSHNPIAPEFLDLCDRLGFVVMAESFDCWKRGKKSNDYQRLFDDWSDADMRSTVRHFRNHASVVMWSIGNEINDQSQPEGPAMAKRLTADTHLEDGTRPSTIGCNNNSAGFNGFQENIDVFGINYFHVNYKNFVEKNPKIPFLSSESSCTMSSRGEYFFGRDSWKTDFQVTSSDECKPGWGTTPDEQFRKLVEFPQAAGEFVWTGFDYLGEPTPYNGDMTNLLNYTTPEAKAAAELELKEIGKVKVPSRSSYFGIVDLAGFKKDRFYLYQALWRPELPMAHLSPHWNWPDRAGQVTPVQVYTSGDEAELFLNGKSLGKKKKSANDYRLKWDDVKYEPGELKAVAYRGGRSWAQDIVKTTGPATKLLLQPDRAAIKSDGLDLSFVTVTVADKDGQLVPRSKNALKFEISGPGEIVATDNGDATDHTTFSVPERKAFNGLALVIVRTKAGQSGAITLKAETPGLPPVTVNVQSVP